MISENTLKDDVRRFIHETFPASAKARIGDDDSLLESGLVDSLGILEIVTFLETQLGLTLADDDVVVENFASINAIARFAAERTPVESPR
jgi:acyl carrier protein